MTHDYKSHGIAEWSDTYKCTQCGDTVTYAAEDCVSAKRANELNGECPTTFKFEQIEGMLELEEACAQLVHIAKCVQETHTENSAQTMSAQTMRTVFESRKSGILALLNVIELYVWQKPLPEKKD